MKKHMLLALFISLSSLNAQASITTDRSGHVWTTPNLFTDLITQHGYSQLVDLVISANNGVVHDTPNHLDNGGPGIYNLSAQDFKANGVTTWWGAKALSIYLNTTEYLGSNAWQLPDYAYEGNGMDMLSYWGSYEKKLSDFPNLLPPPITIPEQISTLPPEVQAEYIASMETERATIIAILESLYNPSIAQIFTKCDDVILCNLMHTMQFINYNKADYFGVLFINGNSEDSARIMSNQFNIQVVPLPTTVWLFGSGLAFFSSLCCKRRKSSAIN